MPTTLEQFAAILADLAARDPFGTDAAGRTYYCLCGGSEGTAAVRP